MEGCYARPVNPRGKFSSFAALLLADSGSESSADHSLFVYWTVSLSLSLVLLRFCLSVILRKSGWTFIFEIPIWFCSCSLQWALHAIFSITMNAARPKVIRIFLADRAFLSRFENWFDWVSANNNAVSWLYWSAVHDTYYKHQSQRYATLLYEYLFVAGICNTLHLSKATEVILYLVSPSHNIMSEISRLSSGRVITVRTMKSDYLLNHSSNQSKMCFNLIDCCELVILSFRSKSFCNWNCSRKMDLWCIWPMLCFHLLNVFCLFLYKSRLSEECGMKLSVFP